jgi:hypothetical protein
MTCHAQFHSGFLIEEQHTSISFGIQVEGLSWAINQLHL